MLFFKLTFLFKFSMCENFSKATRPVTPHRAPNALEFAKIQMLFYIINKPIDYISLFLFDIVIAFIKKSLLMEIVIINKINNR